MTPRFKLVAAVLGLAVAATAAADASAEMATKTVTKHVATRAMHGKAIRTTTTKVIVHRSRPHVGTTIVHRSPVRAKLVKLIATKAAVRVIKRPILQKQAMAHRIVVKKTIIR